MSGVNWSISARTPRARNRASSGSAGSSASSAGIAEGSPTVQYSARKVSQIRSGSTSTPVTSVIRWITPANSTRSSTGRSSPHRERSTWAMPPLPDWLLTRMTAS